MWYDWIKIERKKSSSEHRLPAISGKRQEFKNFRLPAKVVAIFRDPTIRDYGSSVTKAPAEEYNLVIHLCEFPYSTEVSHNTVLTNKWNLMYDNTTAAAPIYQVIHSSLIVDTCFMLEDCPGLHSTRPKSVEVLEILRPCYWAEQFAH